jgi:hypothetical protein
MALQTQRDGRVRISERGMLGAWCPTPRVVRRLQQTIVRHAYITPSNSLVLKKKKATKGMDNYC